MTTEAQVKAKTAQMEKIANELAKMKAEVKEPVLLEIAKTILEYEVRLPEFKGGKTLIAAKRMLLARLSRKKSTASTKHQKTKVTKRKTRVKRAKKVAVSKAPTANTA